MTGFAVTIDGRLEGKRITLVADMDALRPAAASMPTPAATICK